LALVNRKAQKSPSFIEKNIAVGAPTIATRTISDVLFEKPTGGLEEGKGNRVTGIRIRSYIDSQREKNKENKTSEVAESH